MNRRATFLRWVVLPFLVVAAGFLARWTYRTTATLVQLGERSVLASTVLLAREKVDRIEQRIISDDHAVISMVNPDDLDTLSTRWLEAADRVSPTVRSVLLLDEQQRVVRHISRAGETDGTRFRQLFVARVLPTLGLPLEEIGAHKHLHQAFDGRELMISYLTREAVGRRYFIVLETDLEYIRANVLPRLFDDPTSQPPFNIVDEDGRRIYGGALRGPADYVVTRRFPTTLYNWRLSIAAQYAPELAARTRRRQLVDGVMVSASLAVLVAGLLFLAYAARDEQRLNQLKSDFIATVSHELKTPLSLIRMFGEMLVTERVPTEARRKQYLDIIVRESERLSALIDNVLDFAKLERGKSAYEFRRASLTAVVARGVELFRYRLEHERPALVTELASDLSDTEIDERAIQLLLFNLLDNAVKYARGSDVILVRVRGTRAALYLDVEDHGPGIELHERRRVFERFYRGRHAGSGGARGSGIGLALVQHIAEAHGGTVVVSDARPHGTVFTVTLPVRAAPADALRDASRADAATRHD